MKMRKNVRVPAGRVGGFTLLETAMALGIIAFALVSVFALLPVGLGSIKSSSEQRAAASALRSLQARILAAPVVSTNGSHVQSVPEIVGGEWQIGGAQGGPWRIGLNGGGHMETVSGLQSMVAIITVDPPPSRTEAGRANIRIAWPVAAQWTASGWTNAQGFTESSFHFLPRWE